MQQNINIKNSEFARENNRNILIIGTKDESDILKALENTLNVPDIRLKSRIIHEIARYHEERFAEDDYKIKAFIAYNETDNPIGFVSCQIHPEYKSYGRPVSTFGWLCASDFGTCKALMDKCEEFTRDNKFRKLRGPINFPKRFGGIGIQVEGFEEQMMYGVAFGDPNSRTFEYLTRLGYQKESEYTCMKVTKKEWESGKQVDNDIRLGYLTLEELIERKEEIFDLSRNSFQMSFPDTTGAESGFKEMIEIYRQVPPSHYVIKEGFVPEQYSPIPEFVEAWNTCDLEKVVTWVPIAFDRHSGKIVGLILSLPDLYESWLGQPITRNNVDTVMVNKSCAGKGIFSALNNIGQLTCNLNGVTYFEGTSIWFNNKDAVNSIFPHCDHIRKHYMLEKRIRAR